MALYSRKSYFNSFQFIHLKGALIVNIVAKYKIRQISRLSLLSKMLYYSALNSHSEYDQKSAGPVANYMHWPSHETINVTQFTVKQCEQFRRQNYVMQLNLFTLIWRMSGTNFYELMNWRPWIKCWPLVLELKESQIYNIFHFIARNLSNPQVSGTTHPPTWIRTSLNTLSITSPKWLELAGKYQLDWLQSQQHTSQLFSNNTKSRKSNT